MHSQDGTPRAGAAKPVKKPAANAAKPTRAAPTLAGAHPEPSCRAGGGTCRRPSGPPPAPKQFPLAKDIRVGAERENIAEKFGQPSLSTTTTGDDGQVKETLVYARKSGRDVTVIRIEDGKVLSAYSR